MRKIKIITNKEFKIIGLILSIVLTMSCSRDKSKFNNSLKLAGDNRYELEKVIDHYSKNKDDNLKLLAAKFLISNMPGHSTYKSNQLLEYDCFFDLVEQNSKDGFNPAPVRNIWDSLKTVHGLINPELLEISYDINNISANYIISNIEYAFKAWEMPWAKHLLFKDFCQYILPYRFMDEQLEPYRSFLWDKYQYLRDSMEKTDDPLKACKILNDEIGNWFVSTINPAKEYPIAMRASDIMKIKTGNCLNQAALATYIMRTNGVPVTLEYVPQWGNRSNGHYYNAVRNRDGRFVNFLGGVHDPGEYNLTEKPPKIFCRTYSKKENELLNDIGNKNNIPPLLRDPFFIDVTNERINVSDVKVKLNIAPPSKTKYAYLCVFNNNNWVPVFWGKIKNGKAIFKNMGRDIVYLPAYFEDNGVFPASSPIILKDNGDVVPIGPDESNLMEVKISRKYPLSERKLGWMASQIGGTFQGANKPDFSDAVNLYSIMDTVDLVTNRIKIEIPKKYRYLRYLFAPKSHGSISEIGFYTIDGDETRLLRGDKIKSKNVTIQHLNMAFDRKIGNYIGAPKDKYNGEWIGLDLTVPKKIKQISFCPRTDTNNIFEGMTYELFYWKNDWVSLGKKIANNNELVYNNVPAGSLLWLRNLTKGKEERIFMYNNDNQIWW